MSVGVQKDIIYLPRRKKIQLLQLLIARLIQVDRLLVQRVQIRLQLLKIRLTELRNSVVDIEDDFVKMNG